MSPPEGPSSSLAGRLVAFVEAAEETREAPRFVVGALAVVTTALVAASTVTAVETGHTAIAASFLAAVALFLGAVLALEIGRRLDGDD